MSRSSREFLFGNDLPWEEAGPGLKRQVMGFDDSIMMVKVQFQAGGVGQMHDHPHSQVTYVVQGEFEMTIGGEKKIVKEGDSFYVPPHVSHGCVCTHGGILLDVFSPCREDFL